MPAQALSVHQRCGELVFTMTCESKGSRSVLCGFLMETWSYRRCWSAAGGRGPGNEWPPGPGLSSPPLEELAPLLGWTAICVLECGRWHLQEHLGAESGPGRGTALQKVSKSIISAITQRSQVGKVVQFVIFDFFCYLPFWLSWEREASPALVLSQ